MGDNKKLRLLGGVQLMCWTYGRAVGHGDDAPVGL
jgi:hypothetical protein